MVPGCLHVDLVDSGNTGAAPLKENRVAWDPIISNGVFRSLTGTNGRLVESP